MSKIQKAIVRYDVTEAELEKMFYGAGRYGLGGLTVAPVYLPACIKQNKKNLTGKLNVNSIIDFPFGESSLKGKVANIKESVKAGADSVAVTAPSMLIAKENLKQLKKNDFVNIEVDILAKYIEKFLSSSDNKSRISLEFLQEHGF